MIKVTCAIIIRDNHYLVVQRSESMSLPFKWEFPGGKIELGESEEDCLMREIKEELNLEINILGRLPASKHTYPGVEIELIPFYATIQSGNLMLMEHMKYKWMTKEKLESLNWAEADIPIVSYILKNS